MVVREVQSSSCWKRITFPHTYLLLSITNVSFNNLNRIFDATPSLSIAVLCGQLDLRKSVIKTLWPADIIWQLQCGSTLTQVITCCLMAPSHCLNQCWLIIRCFAAFFSRTISKQEPRLLFCIMGLKSILLNWLPYLAGANVNHGELPSQMQICSLAPLLYII